MPKWVVYYCFTHSNRYWGDGDLFPHVHRDSSIVTPTKIPKSGSVSCSLSQFWNGHLFWGIAAIERAGDVTRQNWPGEGYINHKSIGGFSHFHISACMHAAWFTEKFQFRNLVKIFDHVDTFWSLLTDEQSACWFCMSLHTGGQW